MVDLISLISTLRLVQNPGNKVSHLVFVLNSKVWIFRYITRSRYYVASGNAWGTSRLLANINSIPRNLGEFSSNWIPSANVLLPLK